MDQPLYYAGQFLLAMPGMGDERFDHAVIALCMHDANGALGIGIGEEIEALSLHALLQSFDIDGSAIADRPVYRGGPVEPRRGFVLHSLDWGGRDMVQVENAWGLSGSLDILKAIAAGKGPSRYLVALGYAGWGAGQLEAEMHSAGWFLTQASTDLIFDTPTNGRWQRAFASAGVDSAHLVSDAGSA